jgi:phosphopantothenoylcysteine decarboxylase/phosphopantothenate--cysteine ligase
MDANPREILIGVAGGVACYKTAALVSRLVQGGMGVRVVMTAAAQQFIGAATFRALTGRSVVTDMFPPDDYPLGPHIELARQAELFCIAPATGNILAKGAHGLADDLLSTLLLSFEGPVLFAPAMNTQMWSQPSVQRNVAQLEQDGRHMIGPGAGWLSCRDQGAGRMAEPDEIAAKIRSLLGDG